MDKVTVGDFARRKGTGKKIALLTAYDYPVAKTLDEAGVDAILVGDSLGMVVLGYESTASVTMDEMIHHAKAARRGVRRALLIGDMPLMAIAGSAKDAVGHAKRFFEEAGCEAVKVEWRENIDTAVRAIVDAGMPVVGHVGLTPQTAASEGGYGLRGKDARSASRILAQAKTLAAAGSFAMVLECIPDVLAREITQALSIPTIGVGSGPYCDGQVVVTYDLIGLFERFKPKFAKRYANVAQVIRESAASFIHDVQSGAFPGKEQTYSMAAEEFAKLKAGLKSP